MTDTMLTAVWSHRGRPCSVTARERVAKPRIGGRDMGSYERLTVVYLDNQEPRMGFFGAKAWGTQARRMKGAKELVWLRVKELVDQGMEHGRAVTQAAAEVASGVGGHGDVREGVF